MPPSVTGVTAKQVQLLTDELLLKSEELAGCKFTVEHGPEEELDWSGFQGTLERLHGDDVPVPAQFQLMQICTYHRAFRDLAVNPVANSLVKYLIGPAETKFSSHNCFIKWKGGGYGEGHSGVGICLATIGSGGALFGGQYMLVVTHMTCDRLL